MSFREGKLSPSSRVLVTGGTGLVGGAVATHFRALGLEVHSPDRSVLNLLDESSTLRYLLERRPDFVVAAAAVVGGIAANIAEPVRFLVDNIKMQNNLMLAAAASDVRRLVFMSSSCVYPRECRQPMHESDLWNGPLEPTNESYAVAKLAGTQLARSLQQAGSLDTTVLIPSNIYGPGDSFDPSRAHVASSLVKKFVDARKNGADEVEVWGTGKAMRELTHTNDLASATAFILGREDVPFVLNVGTGTDHSIANLAELVKQISGYSGTIRFDTSRPDGMPRKVLDVSVLNGLGWHATIGIEEGLAELVSTYESSPTFEGKDL